MATEISHTDGQQECLFFFNLPTEIQLLIMSELELLELHNAKLICKRFNGLANVDQLWKRLTIEADIDGNIMGEAKDTCGIHWTWQRLLRSATLIDRENKRLMQGSIAQMAHKIQQVREALQRQTQVLEDTQNKLELLSGRLTQMEQQNRAKELERVRARQREVQRLEDERWMKEWDKTCISSKFDCDQREDCRESDSNGSEASYGNRLDSIGVDIVNTKGVILLDAELDERTDSDVQGLVPISIVEGRGAKREGLGL